MRVGPQGWVRFGDADGLADLYLRFVKSPTGRWMVREVYLDSEASITQQSLRGIPLAQCEAWANEEGEMLEERWPLLDPVGDNMSILASHLGTQFQARVWSRSDRRHTNWVVDAYFANATHAYREQVGMSEVRPVAKRQLKAPDREGADRNYRLTEAPDTFPISDEYLLKVARAYKAALQRKDRPNKTIAEDVRVDVRTVERWVSRARAKGYLGPARKGVAG